MPKFTKHILYTYATSWTKMKFDFHHQEEEEMKILKYVQNVLLSMEVQRADFC